MPSSSIIEVYLEVGNELTFAGAVNWPGWCRSGHDESSALRALLKYAPRYERALSAAGLGFQVPEYRAEVAVVERVAGDMATDLGTPGVSLTSDKNPVDGADLKRFHALLMACWATFDWAVSVAQESSGGSGGPDWRARVEHVLAASEAHLSQFGWLKTGVTDDPREERDAVRQAILDAVAAAVHGEIPADRGVIWTPRYFVRREAWHVLDHAWEIEDHWR